ncbi:dihydrofolate reductase family protein [Corynebacterium sp. A21]|uniref:dihydrofolate reductase family protein n=1 Tax=Corynebacterium sp. A21 TaxID=3457318 RepID=UPI003FD5CE20
MKPHLIVHMHTALDGKIEGPHLFTRESLDSQRIYYDLVLGQDRAFTGHRGWLSGTTTSDANFTHHKEPALNPAAAEVPAGDFMAPHHEEMHYFSIDPRGRLAWEQNYIEYFDTRAHIVELLSAQASNSYKAFLRELGISYVIAGEENLDLALALEKLQQHFQVDEFVLGGGGGINWSFIKAGLVDEVSIVLTPVADGATDTASLFDANPKYNDTEPVAFTLKENRVLADGSLWLRYLVKGAATPNSPR